MKQLICELCGSNNLVKNEGVFECQSCGSKYTVEEAKKMIVDGVVDIKGTVIIDESVKKQELINSYIEIAKDSLRIPDCSKVNSYCDKILEIDINNYQAWILKSKSTFIKKYLQCIKQDNNQESEAILYAMKAIEVAHSDIKYNISEDLFNFMNVKIQSDIRNTSEDGEYLVSSIHSGILNWLSILEKLPYIRSEILNDEINKCKKMISKAYSNQQSSFNKKLLNAILVYNNCMNYDDLFVERLKQKTILENNKTIERVNEYWNRHQIEKVKLEKEKEIKIKEKNQLLFEKDELINNSNQLNFEMKIKELTKKKDYTNIFKLAEKKSIQDEIDEIKLKSSEEMKEIIQKTQMIEDNISLHTKIINEIDFELTKDRLL